MKIKLISILAVLFVVRLNAADVQINDFSAFNNPLTSFFAANWAGAGSGPNSDFAQVTGAYEIKGLTATASDANYVDFYKDDTYSAYPTLVGQNSFAVSAKLLSGNTAGSFSVIAYDTGGLTSIATFNTSAFNNSSNTTVIALFSGSASLNSILNFRITGNQSSADLIESGKLLNVSFDNLSATFVGSPIPEPSTYASLAGAAVLGMVIMRRRRQAA